MIRYSLLVTLLAIVVTGAEAQLVLDASRIPAVGETFRSFGVDTSGVMQGPAGANQTWDFSGILMLSEQTDLTYANPAGTPYAGDFPTSNLVGYAVSDDPVYTYMRADGGQASILGMRSDELEVTYDDPQLHVNLPFTYNSTFNDPFSGTMVVLSGAYTARRTGTNMAVGDAYGTIKLPDGNEYSALRIKHVLNTADTVSLPGFTIVTTTVQTSYEWWIEEARFPVLIVSYLRTETLGNVHESRFIEYNNEITTEVSDPAEPLVADFHLGQNFPNPFNPGTTIRFSVPASGPVTLKVYDLIGQEVATLVDGHLNAGVHQVRFNAGHLPSGMYFYTLEAGASSQTRRLMLVK
jgi:hypothetical protein